MGNYSWKDTVLPRSSCTFYILTYFIKWVATSGTDGSMNELQIAQEVLFSFMICSLYKNRLGKLSCTIFRVNTTHNTKMAKTSWHIVQYVTFLFEIFLL